MRTREERVGKISEKMKSKNKLQKGYQSEKAQDFKNKYTEDVKTAATGRRSRRRDRREENKNPSGKFGQDFRKNERRETGMTREEQKAKYGNA